MDERKERAIKDVVETVIDNRGKTPPFAETGYELLEVNAVLQNNRAPDYSKVRKYVSEHTYNNWFRAGHPDLGDILVPTVGTIGNVAILCEKRGAIAQNLIALRCNNTVSSYYLYYFLSSSLGKSLMVSLDIGGVQPSIKVPHLLDLKVHFPPLPEQKAIASVLSSLDDKIDLLHRQNKTLEAIAETLFRQWFVVEAQDYWEEGRLGDFIKVKHGYAFKGKSIIAEKNNQILVTPGNFKIGGGFKFGKMKYFIGSNYPNDYIFSSDDLIVTMTDLSKEGDTLGYPALIPEHNQDEVLYLHNQRVGKVEFKKDLSKYFVYYLMKTDDYQWFIVSGASGTSVRHTSPTSICNYSFQVPPMKSIKEFDTIVNKLISKVHKNQNQIQTLEKLRDTLLPKLMSGEVRVEYDAN